MTKRGKRKQKPIHDAVAESSSFMREVDDALHVERMTEIWHKYRTAFFLSLAVLFLAVAIKEYVAQVKQEALSVEADSYAAYVETKRKGAADIALLSELSQDGHDGFKMLADFQIAQQLSAEGKTAEVETMYKGIAQNASLPTVQRDLARFYLGQIYMSSNPEEAKVIFKALGDEKSAYRYSSVEMLAYIAENEGNVPAAIQFYEFLLNNLAVLPQNLRARVQSRLNILRRAS